jgi:CBS domain containing-hemolysin-like protein
MMTKREAFETVGGMTEELAVAFNDVDYCLKVRKHGWLVVYDPYAEMHHYESKSMLAADSMKANRLFEQMKQQQNYFAVVTDAYGGVTGIVTLCDIMEYLVGDLENTVTA